MKRFLFISLIVTIIIAGLLAFSILNNTAKTMSEAEKEAAMAKILGRQVNINPSSAPLGDTEFKGKYVTFIYPKAAKPFTFKINGKEVKPSGLEQFSFDLDVPKTAFFMEVVSVPSTVKNVNDYPGVKLREINSGIYTQSDAFFGDNSGLVFVKNDNTGYEKTAFFYKDGKVYSFSLQGNDSKSVEDLYSRIMPTVNFL